MVPLVYTSMFYFIYRTEDVFVHILWYFVKEGFDMWTILSIKLKNVKRLLFFSTSLSILSTFRTWIYQYINTNSILESEKKIYNILKQNLHKSYAVHNKDLLLMYKQLSAPRYEYNRCSGTITLYTFIV